MRQLPVKQLTAEQIELSGRLLLSQNGDLLFDNRIIAYYEDLIDVLVVTDRAEFNTLTPKVGDVSKIAETGESYIYNGVWIALHRDKVTTYNILYESELSDLSPIIGDMVRISSIYKTGIYNGDTWTYILSGVGAVIDDYIISNNATWSSVKISHEVNLKQNILVPGNNIEVTDDTVSLLVSSDIDLNNVDLNNTNLVTFSPLFDNGSKTLDFEIESGNGVYQQVIIQESCSLILLEPSAPCTFYIHIYQGTVGNAILTFPTVGWSGGSKKINSLPISSHDLLMIHYYGNNSYVFEMMENISND